MKVFEPPVEETASWRVACRAALAPEMAEALESVWPRYAKKIPEADREDVFQGALMAVWSAAVRRPTYDPARTPKPWISTICKHTVFQFWRSQAKHRHQSLTEVNEPHVAPHFAVYDEIAEYRGIPIVEWRRWVPLAMSRLTPAERAATGLRHLGQLLDDDFEVLFTDAVEERCLPWKEVARQLGRSEQAVRLAGMRGLCDLRPWAEEFVRDWRQTHQE